MPPENFDFENTKEPFCIYCGARYTSRYYDSPLGNNTLCAIHYKIFRKNKISLPENKPS